MKFRDLFKLHESVYCFVDTDGKEYYSIDEVDSSTRSLMSTVIYHTIPADNKGVDEALRNYVKDVEPEQMKFEKHCSTGYLVATQAETEGGRTIILCTGESLAIIDKLNPAMGEEQLESLKDMTYSKWMMYGYSRVYAVAYARGELFTDELPSELHLLGLIVFKKRTGWGLLFDQFKKTIIDRVGKRKEEIEEND